MRALSVLILVITAGCATTPAERAAQAERDVAQMMLVYGPACTKLGYRQESDAWRDCVLRLAAQNDMRRYSRYSYPSTTHCFAQPGFFDCNTF